MSVYWITVTGTLYIIGFFLPFLIQYFFEEWKNKRKFEILRINPIKILFSIYHRKDVLASIASSCFILGLLSIVLANLTMLLLADTYQNKLYSLFIGLWAPTLIGIGAYLRLGHRRSSRSGDLKNNNESRRIKE
jgi:hypothetical protein